MTSGSPEPPPSAAGSTASGATLEPRLVPPSSSAHTTLSGRYRTELTQDIAENEFNENDRDRLTEEARLQARGPLAPALPRLAADRVPAGRRHQHPRLALGQQQRAPHLRGRARLPLLLQSASWNWPRPSACTSSTRTTPSPTCRTVNKDDTFNKRGNLATTVTLKPTSRLDLVVKHDYNQRYNGTRTVRDAAGNTFYRRDQIQTINRIELGSPGRPSWSRANCSSSRPRPTAPAMRSSVSAPPRRSPSATAGSSGSAPRSTATGDRPVRR
jgi:hypothetical protein